ncbi:hypothetical protein BDZ89DRAFT_1057482 [Hymenopellis radicata]|nr:hypothetical protein BDZ89DRAFT_1057482 [Hymenopellis radicata]
MTILISLNPRFAHFDESSVKIVVIVAQAAVLIAALVAFIVLDILGQDGTRPGTHKRRMTLLIMLDVLTLVFQVAYLVVFAISSDKLYWVPIHLQVLHQQSLDYVEWAPNIPRTWCRNHDQ